MATVYIQDEDGCAKHVRLNNDSGADLEQFEFVVLQGHIYVADEAITSGEVGSFAVMEDLGFQISDFVDGEGTFGTENAVVYWDPTSGDFSDTSTATYYPVGIVKEVLSDSGTVLVLGDRVTEAVTA